MHIPLLALGFLVVAGCGGDPLDKAEYDQLAAG
jgi:hypothetical protein